MAAASPARSMPAARGTASVASGSTALRGPLVEADVGSTILLRKVAVTPPEFTFRAKFMLTCRSTAPVALKVMTNRRSRYNIFPNRLLIQPGTQIAISVDVTPAEAAEVASIVGKQVSGEWTSPDIIRLETLAISKQFFEITAGLNQQQVMEALVKTVAIAKAKYPERFMLQDFRCAFSLEGPLSPEATATDSSSPAFAQDHALSSSRPSSHAAAAGEAELPSALTGDSTRPTEPVGAPPRNAHMETGLDRHITNDSSKAIGQDIRTQDPASSSSIPHAADEESWRPSDVAPGALSSSVPGHTGSLGHKGADFASGRAVRGDHLGSGGSGADITADRRVFDSHRSTVVNDLETGSGTVSPDASYLTGEQSPTGRPGDATPVDSPLDYEDTSRHQPASRDDKPRGLYDDLDRARGYGETIDKDESRSQNETTPPQTGYDDVSPIDSMAGDDEEDTMGTEVGAARHTPRGYYAPPHHQHERFGPQSDPDSPESPSAGQSDSDNYAVHTGSRREAAAALERVAELEATLAAMRKQQRAEAAIHAARDGVRHRKGDRDDALDISADAKSKPPQEPGSGVAMWQVCIIALCCVLLGAVLQAVLVGDVAL